MALDGFVSANQARQLRLLEWIAASDEDFPGLAPFYDDDPTAAGIARQDVEALNARGFVDDVSSMGGLAGVAARLTPDGRALVAEVRTARGDRVRRQWACRSAMVSWLADSDASVDSGRYASWQDFLTDDKSMFFADLFSADEVARSSGWLFRQGLIAGPTVAEVNGPIAAVLTDEGIRCAERFDCDVRAYMDAKEAPMTSITWNVTGQQVQVATGDHARQTMNIGPTVEQMALAIEGLVQILAAFDLGGDEQERLEVMRDALDDVRSEHPSGERVRRFITWVRGRLATATNAAVAAALTAQITGLEQDVAHLARAVGVA